MDYELRRLTVAEMARIAHIEACCHRFPMSAKTIESCFGRFYDVIGLDIAGELKGFAILHLLFEDATLMDICVLPECQGQGLGRLLLDAVIGLAARGGAERIMLEVRASSESVIALYRAAGFEQTGIRKAYYQQDQGKEDAVLMTLLF